MLIFTCIKIQNRKYFKKDLKTGLIFGCHFWETIRACFLFSKLTKIKIKVKIKIKIKMRHIIKANNLSSTDFCLYVCVLYRLQHCGGVHKMFYNCSTWLVISSGQDCACRSSNRLKG
jgi:hypothetical protein